MVTQTKTTKALKGRKQVLKTPIEYTYSWPAFENTEEGKAEFIAAKAEMTIEEQLKFRNNEAQANARNIELNKALDKAGIVKLDASNDEQIRLIGTFKMLMTAKNKQTGEPLYTVEKARELASQMVQVEWADAADDNDEE